MATIGKDDLYNDLKKVVPEVYWNDVSVRLDAFFYWNNVTQKDEETAKKQHEIEELLKRVRPTPKIKGKPVRKQ
jgi:hypothetical protein